MQEVHVGDIGTIIRLTIEEDGAAVDVSGASSKQIVLGKPDGTTVTKTAAFTGTGSDGQIQYTTTSASDLDVPGVWRAQAAVAISGWNGRSREVEFRVRPIIG